MNNFKLFDYIIEKSNKQNYFQLENDDMVERFNQDGNFELYIPQSDELCYFFNKDFKYPMIGRFKKIDENGNYLADIVSYVEKTFINCLGECEIVHNDFEFCTPFGMLPIQYSNLLGE